MRKEIALTLLFMNAPRKKRRKNNIRISSFPTRTHANWIYVHKWRKTAEQREGEKAAVENIRILRRRFILCRRRKRRSTFTGNREREKGESKIIWKFSTINSHSLWNKYCKIHSFTPPQSSTRFHFARRWMRKSERREREKVQFNELKFLNTPILSLSLSCFIYIHRNIR